MVDFKRLNPHQDSGFFVSLCTLLVVYTFCAVFSLFAVGSGVVRILQVGGDGTLLFKVLVALGMLFGYVITALLLAFRKPVGMILNLVLLCITPFMPFCCCGGWLIMIPALVMSFRPGFWQVYFPLDPAKEAERERRRQAKNQSRKKKKRKKPNESVQADTMPEPPPRTIQHPNDEL